MPIDKLGNYIVNSLLGEKENQMKVRAKFTVTKVAELGNYNGGRLEIQKKLEKLEDGTPINSGSFYKSTGVPVREITMSAVYGGSEENQSFAESTPSGSITFQLNNSACADEFKPGDAYYVEFTRI
jgi:hypothetical protein